MLRMKVVVMGVSTGGCYGYGVENGWRDKDEGGDWQRREAQLCCSCVVYGGGGV
ncbi:hypothetical protein A2U01_0035938, partial [Trifolium medium]|nr:hypothetical protein [Trifolium medium]